MRCRWHEGRQRPHQHRHRRKHARERILLPAHKTRRGTGKIERSAACCSAACSLKKGFVSALQQEGTGFSKTQKPVHMSVRSAGCSAEAPKKDTGFRQVSSYCCDCEAHRLHWGFHAILKSRYDLGPGCAEILPASLSSLIPGTAALKQRGKSPKQNALLSASLVSRASASRLESLAGRVLWPKRRRTRSPHSSLHCECQ